MVILWKAVPKAKNTPADVRTGIGLHGGKMPGALLQISFYFLSVQIGISPLDDAVLHKKGSAAGHEWGGHRGAGIWSVSSAWGGADDIYSGSGNVGLWK